VRCSISARYGAELRDITMQRTAKTAPPSASATVARAASRWRAGGAGADIPRHAAKY